MPRSYFLLWVLVGLTIVILSTVTLPTKGECPNPEFKVNVSQIAKRITYISCQGLKSTDLEAQKRYRTCRYDSSKEYNIKDAIAKCEHETKDFDHKNATIDEVRDYLCNHVTSPESNNIHNCLGLEFGKLSRPPADSATLLEYMMATTIVCFVDAFGKPPELFKSDEVL